MRKPAVKLGIGLALGGCSAILALALGLVPFAQVLEMKTYDIRVRAASEPDHASRDIVLVKIDDYSIQNLEPVVGRWPWPRFVHADLLQYLNRGPARVVGYDVLFPEHDLTTRKDLTVSGADSDQMLVAATGTVPVVHAVAVDDLRTRVTPDHPAVLHGEHWPASRLNVEAHHEIQLPFKELAQASRALGHTLFVLDPDGPVRRAIPLVRQGERFHPSLSLAIALTALGVPRDRVSLDDDGVRLPDRTIPLVTERIRELPGTTERRYSRRMLIAYPGPAFRSDGRTPLYPTYSFYDVFRSEYQLREGQKPDINPAVFKNKIVLVGIAAYALEDVFETPFGEGKMPGIQVHASVVDDILAKRFLRPAPRAVHLAMVFGTAIGVGLAAAFGGFWGLVVAAAVLLVGTGVYSVTLFQHGVWVPLVQPGFGPIIAAFGGVAYHYFVEGHEKRKVKRVFSRFVSRDVYHQLMEDPTRARLGGQRREMSVLFSDIRGFTTVSEAGEPEAIIGQLNEYFSRIVEVVFAHRGTVDKFVGDMVMALYGAPLDDPDHADHAVETALEMLVELGRLNAGWQAKGMPQLDIGIGINSGGMVAGNLGSESIMSYTVIGDNVNLGSRLESSNKQYGTHIILSDGTLRRLKRQYFTRPLGEVRVKGKSRAVLIHEVCASQQELEAKLSQATAVQSRA